MTGYKHTYVTSFASCISRFIFWLRFIHFVQLSCVFRILRYGAFLSLDFVPFDLVSLVLAKRLAPKNVNDLFLSGT